VNDRRARKTGFVVAIDGPAGAGKSTLARRLAADLGLAYINTGAIYRALALKALRAGVDVGDGPALAELARGIRFSTDHEVPPSLLIDGEPPGDDLLTAEVEAVVSLVARHPEVRAVLRAEQRRLGAPGAVVEGRDIGTVVFPDADVKLFLSAPSDIRVRRRERERGGDAGAGEAVVRRDALDAKTNPLEPAPDAYVLDTTRLGPQEVLHAAARLVGAAMRGDVTR
jgi:CMP/dCMP kinase